MILILAVGALLSVQAKEETYPVTLTLEAMHCEECRESLEGNLRRLRGVKSVEIGETSATVAVLEKHPVRLRSVANAVPSDLKLLSITLTIRGIVSRTGEDLSVRAKGSGQSFLLDNKDKDKADVVGELRKSLAVPPRYSVTGELVERDKKEILLLGEPPSKAEWKDEK